MIGPFPKPPFPFVAQPGLLFPKPRRLPERKRVTIAAFSNTTRNATSLGLERK
jgi:hypothetical protein